MGSFREIIYKNLTVILVFSNGSSRHGVTSFCALCGLFLDSPARVLTGSGSGIGALWSYQPWRFLLMPIIRRQRQPPNVLRSLQFDSAVSWLIRIDVHDLGCSAFVCETDMNRDFHFYAQGNGSHNQGIMELTTSVSPSHARGSLMP